MQNQLIGVKEDKKKEHKPIVIQIDEDELLDNNVRVDTRESNRMKNKHRRLKSTNRGRGHLRIQAEESLQELDDLKIKEQSEKSEKASESEESNIWTRRQRRKEEQEKKKQEKPSPVEQNLVVWDEYNE